MEALLAQLHTLDNHSALYILHSLTPLAQFEERKIQDLLQQLPNSPGTGQLLHHPRSSCLLESQLNFEVNCQKNNVNLFPCRRHRGRQYSQSRCAEECRFVPGILCHEVCHLRSLCKCT